MSKKILVPKGSKVDHTGIGEYTITYPRIGANIPVEIGVASITRDFSCPTYRTILQNLTMEGFDNQIIVDEMTLCLDVFNWDQDVTIEEYKELFKKIRNRVIAKESDLYKVLTGDKE